jgi:hypothetical protein
MISPTTTTRVCAMPDNNEDKREMRMMWVASVGIALLILGAMGINVPLPHDTSAALTEPTQSSTESPK